MSNSIVYTTQLQGWQAVHLENDLLHVIVLPVKGADTYAIIDKSSGIDFLAKTPWGLQPPGSPPRQGSEGMPFLHNYEGSWQEQLPNLGQACIYRGHPIPFHGEVATLPWEYGLLPTSGNEIAVHLAVRCQQVPLRLERVMRLQDDEAVLHVAHTITNESNQAVDFIWGQHLVLGAPFLEAGCRLESPATRILTPDPLFEQTHRLAEGQDSTWPWVELVSGGQVDLRLVPGAEAHSHDDAFLTDFDQGWVVVTNQRLGLTFRLDWDASIFRYMTAWMPYGGADAMPLSGFYGLGIEPWSTRWNLEQAIVKGEALALPPDGILSSLMKVSILPQSSFK